MNLKFARVVLPLICLVMAGCASGIAPLESKSARTPNGVDLGGDWRLKGESGHVGPLADEPLRIPASSRTQRSNRRSSGDSVHVFLEFGRDLKITQTPYGMFFSYDRAIVEEYTFGENREVTVGPIEAQRVSGWEGNAFVVETRDRRGNTLIETWRLNDSAELQRVIRIVRDEREIYALTERFGPG